MDFSVPFGGSEVANFWRLMQTFCDWFLFVYSVKSVFITFNQKVALVSRLVLLTSCYLHFRGFTTSRMLFQKKLNMSTIF